MAKDLNKKFPGGTAIRLPLECSTCHKECFWISQTCVGDTKYYRGNVDLASSIFTSGASATEVVRVLNLMGTHSFTCRTYHTLQSDFIIPTVNEKYDDMIIKLQMERVGKDDLVLAGDGRFDSPGTFINKSVRPCAY